MFEVDVKNVTEKGRRGGDQLGFGVLILSPPPPATWPNVSQFFH